MLWFGPFDKISGYEIIFTYIDNIGDISSYGAVTVYPYYIKDNKFYIRLFCRGIGGTASITATQINNMKIHCILI